MDHDLSTAKTGKGQRDYLHFETRSPWTLANLRTAQPWKRSDVPSEKKPRTLSTGKSVAFILALAVGIALIVLVSVFVIFRRRYGPRYTVRCFVTGKCPKTDRRARSAVPVSIESGFPCRETCAIRNLTSAKTKSGDSKCVTGTDNPHRMSTLSQAQTETDGGHSAVIDSNRLSVPPRDSHPEKTQTENREIGNTGRRKPPPPALQRSDLRAATEQLRALAPTSPNSSRFTTSTQSSGPLPSIYRMALESRSHKRNSSNNTNCWSFNQDTRSAVDSEDRVLSLPSPSPMLRNILRPSPKPEPSPPHVYRMIQRPPSAHHCDTRVHENDVVLPMLPRSIFAVNDLVVSK
ncbi:uncharacterized protein ASPGLDRAFT_30213 [Aspergillus glaucus CBS 516.65]|uniref:Uncharacterized protein n=1 Tax=Aspergillus glaucus CBS 516.65 TaxID=1160497 RepID=A0A1L9V544_ASPGL|nr:hypothetical protein ASPGLDRAFT_30213 [Aspergillus glaucus CBS 516.65]OJJ79063.1 hypothetical protein ASPGLDRAFT_30213 [Aspergillus glaucus CBS 516.65]